MVNPRVQVKPSTLYVVATPIGNLGDMTPRAIEVLGQVDVVLAEDTRVTRKLLTYFDIQATLERFDEPTSRRRTPEIIDRLQRGDSVALVSDAGTPGISDPGAVLVDMAREAHVDVVALPGASALLAALVASGLPTDSFYFSGFLPRKKVERAKFLETVRTLDATLVFYESPHRTQATLKHLAEMFPDRIGVLARELTKIYEEIIRLPLPELAELIGARETIKGEVVLLVGPPAETGPLQIEQHGLALMVQAKMELGLSRSSAIKEVSSELGISRNTVYDAALSKSNAEQ